MNVLMAALSVQLSLYGAAWIAVALGFRLYPRTSLRWAAGWLVSALGTAVLFWRPPVLAPVLDLVVNLSIIAAFILLQQGISLFLREPLQHRVAILALGVLTLIEVVRLLWPDTMVLRTWMFTLAVGIALGPMVRDLLLGLPRKFQVARPIAATAALPVALALLAFVVRAAVISYSEVTGVVELDVGSTFDVVVNLGFLVFLGMFNFSLYHLVLGSLIRKLEDLAATDQLTGLYNRRVMIERLDVEHARFQRSGQRYAIIMMDLDHFKAINDTHGHHAGDDVLREVAARLQQSVRGTDTLARMGGEEFLLLLPMNDTDGALIHAGRIRKHMAAAPVKTTAGDIAITISLGVAEVFHSDQGANTVISRADAALYRAKAAGRNRVEAAERAPLPTTP